MLLAENDKRQRISILSIIIILLLALALRLWRTDTFGIGHEYYGAAAVNMLESVSNFFFVVADAGGVTVDKTPISLWLQSLSVGLIGVSGFALVLPSIFAGILSISILYRLVSRDFGRFAGTLSAFILATTPISIAVDHSNVADSILILAMLLATWGFLRAIRHSTLRHVIYATALMGIAFNVKMLQSFLAAPAFYAVYFFAAKGTWWRKFQKLILGTLVLIIVSSSWLAILEFIPPDNRPWIGSTRKNSSIELVFGYSALFRFLGSEQYYALIGETAPGSVGAFVPSVETGSPGPLRFFQKELGNELSWLLPFAFWSMLILLFRAKLEFPLRKEHRALVLWGTWLIAGMIILSQLSFLHAFYLATIVPALAALVGIGILQIGQLLREKPIIAQVIASIALFSTITFQLILASYYPIDLWLLWFVLIISISSLIVARMRAWQSVAITAYLISLFWIPFVWGLATAEERFDVTVPVAYEARDDSVIRSDLSINFVEGDLSIVDIVQRDDRVRYDLVVSNQGYGAHITLLTDLRVLYLGGFSGNDPIYTVRNFARLIENGEIGYVLDTGFHPEIMGYVEVVCTQVRTVFEPYTNLQTGERLGGAILFQCFS